MSFLFYFYIFSIFQREIVRLKVAVLALEKEEDLSSKERLKKEKNETGGNGNSE